MSLELDKIKILELANRFERYFDLGDFEGHMKTWTDRPLLESTMGDYDGTEAYRKWLEEFYAQTQAAGKTRHLITNSDIVVKGDAATAQFYLTVINRKSGLIMGTATFDDQLVRVGDDWRFARRKLGVDENMNVGN